MAYNETQQEVDAEKGIFDLREKTENKFQEVPEFNDEWGVKDIPKRGAVTPEKREQMDQDTEKLGDLFEGADFKWQLDGGMNISLMKGEYIGTHKDFDVTFDPNDLPAIERHLFERGYGLFVPGTRNQDKPGKRMLEWATTDQFATGPEAGLVLSAIDKEGKIRQDESLTYVDVHLIRRGKDGKPQGFYGASLPEEWYEPQPVEFHGRKINLSHPAKIAYFKLFDKRGYDTKDLDELVLTGRLTEQDLNNIEEVVDQGFEKRNSSVGEIVNRVAQRITNEMSEAEIVNEFIVDPAVEASAQTEEGKKRIGLFAAEVVKEKDRSAENIKNLAFKMFSLDAEKDAKSKQIEKLKKSLKSGYNE